MLRVLDEGDRPVVDRLWQLYSHDMSEVRGTMPNDEGVYKCGRLTSYLGDPDRRGYLISWQHAPAGFAFVQGLLQEPRMIGDFFVVRGARRRGVGAAVAREFSVVIRDGGRSGSRTATTARPISGAASSPTLSGIDGERSFGPSRQAAHPARPILFAT